MGTRRHRWLGRLLLTENRLPQLRADTDVFTTFEGDNRVLLQLVAKGLLTGYRDQLGDLDALGMVRFVADQVLGAVAERTSARNLLDRLRRVAPGRDETPVPSRACGTCSTGSVSPAGARRRACRWMRRSAP